MSWYDIVRWVLLVLLFAGLFGVWFWSKRQALGQNPLGAAAVNAFKITQKRWIDQRTAICLVEADDKSFLLAYTVGGGVSWQSLDKAASKPVTTVPLPAPTKT